VNKLIVDQKQFNGLVNNLCRQIAKSNWLPDYIVGIVPGGLVAATMLSKYFEVPLYTLNATAEDPESNLWMSEDAFGCTSEPKKILIVNDVNRTGKTLNWIKQDWQTSSFPNGTRWNEVWNGSTRFAVLYDFAPANMDVDIDYSAVELAHYETDELIFPYENWWE